MSHPSSPDFEWSGDRGKKWRERYAGMEAMLAPVDEPLIRALELESPVKIADIGCGAGGTTLRLQREAPTGSAVSGFDISAELVDVARTRTSSPNSPIEFTIADVGRDMPSQAPFDRLVSRFGVMFFPGPANAFKNLHAWLKPGGRFAFAVWAETSENPWVAEIRQALVQVVDVPKPEPDAPGPFRYADGEKLKGLLKNAGFGNITVEKWQGRLPVGGGLPASEAARFALSAFSIAEVLAGAAPEVKERAHALLTERYARFERDGRVSPEASVLIYTGTR